MESFWRVKDVGLRWYFAIILLTFSFAACSRSPFEQQHRRAVDENPDGVELEIRTRGEKKQFLVSEPVVFEEFYTSKHPGLWKIEIFEGQNVASNPRSDMVHITDGNAVWDQPRELWVGIFCCDSRYVWLAQEEVRIPYKLWPGRTPVNPEGWPNPDWHVLHLPNQPGTYRVYVTTHRVVGHYDEKNPLHDSGRPVSSNILDLQVK